MKISALLMWHQEGQLIAGYFFFFLAAVFLGAGFFFLALDFVAMVLVCFAGLLTRLRNVCFSEGKAIMQAKPVIVNAGNEIIW